MVTINNKVIVWGIDNFNTLGLMRELGTSDLDLLFLIKGKSGYAARSRYCKHYVETTSTQDGFNYLKQNFNNEKYKPIVIVSGDDVAVYLDLHRDELMDQFYLPITRKKGELQKYTDKYTMTCLAKSIGILCPESYKIRWNSEIGAIDYPSILKPSHENPGHYNEFKYKICKNKRELISTLKYVRHSSEFILQTYIQKELDLLVYGARMRDGQTVIAGTMFRDRLDIGGSTSHGYIKKGVPECIDQEKIALFLETVDYYGLFSFEYGMIGDQAYFYEVNLRNDGTSDYFNQAGMNMPLAYIYSCVGMDYHSALTDMKQTSWYIDELFDIENVICGKIKYKEWKNDLEKATIYKYYNKKDVEPYKSVKKTRVKTIIRDVLLKRYRLFIVFILDKMGLRK